MNNPSHIAISICTYRRPKGLEATLSGVAAQRFSGARPLLTVIVVDNEGSPKIRNFCDEFAKRHDLKVIYVHEADRGISQARNAGLQNLPDDAEFVAMIDDDEVPAPDWLDRLLSAQRQTDADVVHGPVAPVFPDDAPAWIVEGRFFGWPRSRFGKKLREWPHLSELRSAATNNALIRLAFLRPRGVRFEPILALTGGEDALFFRDLHQAGARIVWTSDAWVSETVPADRACFSYLWRGAFGVGNKKLLVELLRDRDGHGAVRAVRAHLHMLARGFRFLGKGTLSSGRALLTTRYQMLHFATAGLYTAYGLGILASLVGLRYHHYLRPTGDATAQSLRAAAARQSNST